MPANAPAWITPGWLIALLVLLGVFVLWLLGDLPPPLVLILGALAVARLVP